LFNAVRFRVYAAWPCDITTVGVIAAEEATRLGSPIAARQLTGMVRNIHRWMKRRWKGRRTSTGKYINRGRDSLAVSGLDLAERQAVAGRRTAEARARITDEQLRTAVARLENRGLRVTQAAIAAEAGVSIRTVARWQQPDIRCPSVKDAATACFRINDEATVHCGAPSAHAALILGSGSSGTESLFERGS
jgi:hypothetical protein